MQSRMDEATVIQQGRTYAFGRVAGNYAIWKTTSLPVELVEQFPLSPESWHRARRRFEELEGTRLRAALEDWPSYDRPAHPATSIAKDGFTLACAGTVAVGVLLGVVALFPRYLAGTSIVNEGDQLLPHIFYLAGWSATAVALVRGGWIARIGAFFGIGLSLMTFGFYLSDLGAALSGNSATGGPGLYIAIIGWLGASSGCAVAVYRLRGDLTYRREQFVLGKVRARRGWIISVAILLAVGVAVSFVPSWDRYTLVSIGTGQSQSVTAGYAFSNPAPVIAANVVIIVFFIVLVALALAWRDLQVGLALFAGAVLPEIGQIFSAVVQAATPPSASSFGITPAQAAAAQLQVGPGFTAWYYLYCCFVALLIVGSIALSSAEHKVSERRHLTDDPLHRETASASLG